jgi:hypothetical protein
MPKLMKPDGTIVDVLPQYPAGFLPSEMKRLLETEEFLFIPINDELFMIVALQDDSLPKNEAATTVVRKALRKSNHDPIKGLALLANTHDLQFWLLQPPDYKMS